MTVILVVTAGLDPAVHAESPRTHEFHFVTAGQPGPAFGRPGCKLDPAVHAESI
jgi:hypothetical protein